MNEVNIEVTVDHNVTAKQSRELHRLTTAVCLTDGRFFLSSRLHFCKSSYKTCANALNSATKEAVTHNNPGTAGNKLRGAIKRPNRILKITHLQQTRCQGQMFVRRRNTQIMPGRL